MTNPLKPVLIGDPQPQRFNWLKDLLEREFDLDVVHADNFDQVKALVRAPFGTPSRWSLIVIAEDLPPNPNAVTTPEILQTYFTSLGDLDSMNDFMIVLAITKGKQFRFPLYKPTCVIQISENPTAAEYQNWVQSLTRFTSLQRLTGAEITWDQKNRILRKQIRGLSDRRDLSDGEEHLRQLIGRCLKSEHPDPIQVRPVGQGKSGAAVFRLITKPISTTTRHSEYLLKLCRFESLWKTESEIRGHLKAEPNLSHHGYHPHLPVLHTAKAPTSSLGTNGEPNQYIVRSGPWYAIHFDFVGDSFGRFVDLETAITGSAQELEERTESTAFDIKNGDPNVQRSKIFSTLLDWLCETLYLNPNNKQRRRELIQIWDSGEAPEREYVIMPPYKFTGRSKRWIADFLDSHESQLGSRFFTDWKKHADRVSHLVSEDMINAEDLGQLGRAMPVFLSHVHGDLNSSNILLWLEKEHPFLIDFPFFQETGHVLQDFARLEVEIKLALMDRQKDSPQEKLQAYEHTYSQMDLWQEMELHLLNSWEEPKTTWGPKGYPANVSFCLQLVQLIRTKAKVVQQNNQCEGPPAGDFLEEYLPALLYHTVRSIGFPSNPLFKRLLAVYSAGLMLEKLNAFQNTI